MAGGSQTRRNEGGGAFGGMRAGSDQFPATSPEWGHIGQPEFIATITLLIAGKVFLTFPATLTERAKTSGWIVTTIGALVAAAGVLVIISLMNRFPDYSLARVSISLAGPVIGSLLNLALSLFFLVLAATILREAAETLVIGILPTTPLSVLVAVMALVVAYGAYLGIEAVSRTVFLLSPWLMGLLAAIVLSDATFFDFQRLLPVWSTRPADVIWLGVVRSVLYGEVVSVAFLYPALRRKRPILGGTLLSMGLAWVIITGIMVSTVATFGVTGAARTAFPIYFMARLIHFGRFLQRVEALFIFLWFFSAALNVTVAFYIANVAVSETLRLPNYRPLVPAMALILYTVAFLAPSYIAVVNFEADVIRGFGSLICFGIPLLLMAVAVITGKRQPGTGAGGQGSSGDTKGASADAG
ncbi:MAG: GerAB/ArcD/ProY family transporter [Bacillota bacterium]